MDPNPLQPSVEQAANQPTATDKISQATGEYIHNNYDTWLRKLFGFLFMILNFIRSTAMQMVNQIFK